MTWNFSLSFYAGMIVKFWTHFQNTAQVQILNYFELNFHLLRRNIFVKLYSIYRGRQITKKKIAGINRFSIWLTCIYTNLKLLAYILFLIDFNLVEILLIILTCTWKIYFYASDRMFVGQTVFGSSICMPLKPCQLLST